MDREDGLGRIWMGRRRPSGWGVASPVARAPAQERSEDRLTAAMGAGADLDLPK